MTSSNTNATTPGHIHIHVPDSDGVIILMLGAVVFLTFALGLVSQLCEMSLFPFPRKRSYQIYAWSEDADGASNHQMADLDLEAGVYRPLASQPPSRPQSRAQGQDQGQGQPNAPFHPQRPKLVSRPTTRYGSIKQHEVTVNGTKKLVLVVDNPNQASTCNGVGSPDGYSEWFERWRRYQEQQEEERRREEEELRGAMGMGMGETMPLLEGSEPLMEFAVEEDI